MRIPKGAAFIRGKALIRGRFLLQCGYLKVLIRGRRLFETWSLLEEMRKADHISSNFLKAVFHKCLLDHS